MYKENSPWNKTAIIDNTMLDIMKIILYHRNLMNVQICAVIITMALQNIGGYMPLEIQIF